MAVNPYSEAKEYFITLLKKQKFGAFIIVFTLAAGYIFVLGESGLLERMMLAKKKEFLLERIDFLKEHNQKLKDEIRSDRTPNLTDFLNAGFIPQGGRVIALKGLKEDVQVLPSDENIECGGFRMNYLRGIYCVLSLLMLLFYFSYWGRSYKHA